MGSHVLSDARSGFLSARFRPHRALRRKTNVPDGAGILIAGGRPGLGQSHKLSKVGSTPTLRTQNSTGHTKEQASICRNACDETTDTSCAMSGMADDAGMNGRRTRSVAPDEKRGDVAIHTSPYPFCSEPICKRRAPASSRSMRKAGLDWVYSLPLIGWTGALPFRNCRDDAARSFRHIDRRGSEPSRLSRAASLLSSATVVGSDVSYAKHDDENTSHQTTLCASSLGATVPAGSALLDSQLRGTVLLCKRGALTKHCKPRGHSVSPLNGPGIPLLGVGPSALGDWVRTSVAQHLFAWRLQLNRKAA